jgi:poly(3-hydroxybutyrate) depolymerase
MKTKILCAMVYSISLIACGGGGSESDSVVPIAAPSSVQTATNDACIPVGALLECSLVHQGLERTFKIYEPSSIEESTSTPVVFNFHGYGSNADEQLFYGDFRQLSEQEGFLLVLQAKAQQTIPALYLKSLTRFRKDMRLMLPKFMLLECQMEER